MGPPKKSLLASDRGQTIELVLGKLKLPVMLICKGLMTFDVLQPEAAESLIGILPTEDEIKLVREFEGDRALLGIPETYVDGIRKINGFQARATSIVFV